MNQAVIYKIRNVTNQKFYVGSTTNKRERFRSHRSRLRRGAHHCPHLQAAWGKYGEECFVFEVVEVVDCADSLWEAEERWLSEHFGKPHCYNAGRSPDAPMRGRIGELSPNFGVPVSSEQKQAISETLKRFYAEDPANHPRLGALHTPETREKISLASQKALAEGKAGKFIPTAETRKKMSDALKGNKCALGYKRTPQEVEAIRQRMLGNTQWLGKKHTAEARQKMSKRVVATSLDGERILFESLTATIGYFGFKMPTLNRALKSGVAISKGTHKGWHFRYAMT